MTNYYKIENAIKSLKDTQSKASLLMAAFDGDAPEYKTIIISKDVVNSFKNMFSNFLTKFTIMHNNGDLKLVKYTSGFKPDAHHIEFIHVTDTQFESIANTIPNASDALALSPDDKKFVSRLKFYVLTITNDDKNIYFFKRYSQTKELGHKNGFIISWMGSQYNKINDSAFSFDDTIDCIINDGILFSFNKKNTEIIFKYYEEITKNAFSTIDKISKHIPIHNLETFKRDCSTHLNKLEKLRNISQKGYLPKLDIEKIREIIKKFKLNVKIVNVEGVEMLEHDTKDKWALLNLLDDSYLSSLLTGNDYEVNSKIPI